MGLHPARRGWFVGRMVKVPGLEPLVSLLKEAGPEQGPQALQQQVPLAGQPLGRFAHLQLEQAEDDGDEWSLSQQRGFFGEECEWM